MSAAAVETIDLKKQYPKVEALRGVSLRIEPGEIFALLGPNGAGKTTWISTVCGLVRPTAGSASVLGHDVVRDPVAARKQLGLVPQEINFDPFFTPREVLRFQQGYYGLPVDDNRIDEVLAALGLADKADANTRELSGGMKRRLLIGKALVHRPRVAFLDEPTAGVDVALRRELWAYVRRLRHEGTTIVLTTHYLEEAEALADRVAVIDHGQLLALDTPNKLLAKQGKRRVHFTLGAPLENAPPGGILDEARTLLTFLIPEHGLSDLLRLVAALPVPVFDMRTEQPSLEQVFLSITGGRA